MKSFFQKKPQNKIHVAITPQVLHALLRNGQLHAADFNCLDFASKLTVWKLLLQSATLDFDTKQRPSSPEPK